MKLLWIGLIFIVTQEVTAKIIIPQDPISESGYADRTQLPNPFTLVSWNLYKSKKDSFFTVYDKLIQKADLFLAQEFLMNSQNHQYFKLNHSREYVFATSFKRGENFSLTGIFTASTAQLDTPAIWIRSKSREPILNTPKMTLLTTYRVSRCQQSLQVINTHAINFVTLKAYKKHLSSIAKMINKEGPVIWAGDFNNWTRKRRSALLTVISDLNLKTLNFSPDERVKFNGHVIDHIFYRGLKKVEASSQATDVSDHTPLVSKFLVDC